ncbi:MAG: adenylate/guanylate cyclase domain-containing protein [Treponema sp.]|nr:adenylate/guanylate cyclase domain-containing protein [Treponema sp.]
MIIKWKTWVIGFAVVVFFSIIYAVGVFGHLGNQVYDAFLRFRVNRERYSNVVFLNVDDHAIAYNGIFPWPRSVTADGILRLKEYGARALIFDIEFIDRGPQGVDTIYLTRGLPADFDRSFSEINSAMADVFHAIRGGFIDRYYIDDHAQAFFDFIDSERNRLFTSVQRIARDNDEYLIQASRLFGRSWVTLNMRTDPLRDEQAERRPIAEERFSHRIMAAPNAHQGRFVDVLPPLPGLALSAEGAGFTNVEIDADGIRRRLYLTQYIDGYWYLQLAFAPLLHYLGNPEIELERRRLIIRNAQGLGDITIPLDNRGRMLLDWPPEDYFGKFHHVSFVYFSLMDDLEVEMELYVRALDTSDIFFFSQFDSALERVPFITRNLSDLFDAIHEARAHAMENACGESFAYSVNFRRQSRGLIREILYIDPAGRVNDMLPDLIEAFPWAAEGIHDAARSIATLTEYLRINLDRYEEIDTRLESELRDKFVILGRVDTGTTDIGANPFWGEYINVGTHGVVLDMILSGSFINPIDIQWRILFTFVFVLLFFVTSAKLAPVPRTVSGFLASILVIFAAIMLFRFTGIFFSPLITTFAMVSAVILREIISYSSSEREKQFIRKAFSTYVSDEVVKEIISDPSRLQLGGTKRHMTAIFTDLKGFSTMAEQVDPEVLVSILNRYLTAMSDVVLAEKGTIDKYIGDAIVAFFGAPVEMSDHALRACLSAITMRRIERELNKAILAEKISPVPLLTRIGINTGSMVAGNMGTENKMNYTIMGNAVNLAARLESANKQYGTWILAPEQTILEAGDSILSRKLDRIRVVGIKEPIQIYEVINTMENATPGEKELVDVFQQAMGYYEKREWQEAMQGFWESMAIDGGPSEMYLKRCEDFLENPPEDNWDGVYNLKGK